MTLMGEGEDGVNCKYTSVMCPAVGLTLNCMRDHLPKQGVRSHSFITC